MPRFSNRPFLATTISFLSSRAADSLESESGEKRQSLYPLQLRRVKSKGAPGLAFETWDPSNQFPLKTPTLFFVIRSAAEQPPFPCNGHLLFVIPSVPGFPASPLSPATTYVVLPKENHMQLTEAATLDRKSGEAEGSAVRHSCAPLLPARNLHPSSPNHRGI
jgi:hypothetical protein